MLREPMAPLLASLLVALIWDALAGDPAWLHRRLPHPVVLIGRAIAALEARLLADRLAESAKRWRGVALLGLLVGGALAVGLGLQHGLRALPGGWLLEGMAMGVLLAQRGLVQHVRAVAAGLERGLAAGRHEVARIVGRDPERLDAHGVGRAAVESLAENLADGVVAPLFWGLVGGLPAMLAYKAVNTADSMVGHKNARYRSFGWASARLDDLLNLVPARLTGLALCLAGWLQGRRPLRATFAVMRRDAPRHRSPNAGWPEAAMAAVLGVRLAGPRSYGGETVADAWMGDERAEVTAQDIRAGLAVAWGAWWLIIGALALALIAATLR
jgi:adenosylcobinamide-phosphate synthase